MDSYESPPPGPLPPVRKTVDVPIAVDGAFAVFTETPTEWWPDTHVLTAGREAVVFEPVAGGRWYERGADGAERDWGRVLAWEPPRRIVLSWLIDGDFQPIQDDDLASRVAITFTPIAPDRTTVELAHVELHRHGPAAAKIRATIDGPSPGETLAGYAAVVADTLARKEAGHAGASPQR